ncbi:MAG TPA: aldo/keto reductase [Microbacteriaceae bacterium]|nr:aldo/keto reductase [Microbacteriaceae bacterium]
MATAQVTAERAGQITLGGELSVNRLGYGAMQLTGKGVWGPPADPDEAMRVLRRAVELGVTFIDTADSYGPFVAEELIRKALHPYPDDLVIATKAGQVRPGPDKWVPLGRPEFLRQEVEMSLMRLGVERIDLLQLHRIDKTVPLEDQIGELAKMRDEGKIRYLGISEVSVAQLQAALAVAPIVAVQNRYNLAVRDAEAVLDYAEANGLAFIPWFPLETGKLAAEAGPTAAIAERLGATPSQLALAWLLRRSKSILPIPGTSKVAHLEQNIAAAGLELTDDDVAALTAAVA